MGISIFAAFTAAVSLMSRRGMELTTACRPCFSNSAISSSVNRERIIDTYSLMPAWSILLAVTATCGWGKVTMMRRPSRLTFFSEKSEKSIYPFNVTFIGIAIFLSPTGIFISTSCPSTLPFSRGSSL